MTFKQQYLHANGPFTFDFTSERTAVFIKISQLLLSIHPNQWSIRGLTPITYIQSFKQVYGLTSSQTTKIVTDMFNLLKSSKMSCEGSIAVLKILVAIKQFRISFEKDFVVDNSYFLGVLKKINEEGIQFTLKNADLYLDTLFKVIRSYCRFGEEVFQETFQLFIQKRDIKYLALFIRSIKNQTTAQKILALIFQQSSALERNTSFYLILAELTAQFPALDLAQYHQTLSHEIIKCITTVVDPENEEELKKIVSSDSSIGGPCILKSVARILVNCLRPIEESGWEKYWSCIERIFSIIGGIIDHSHTVVCINDFLVFIEYFVRSFLSRYRKERGLFKEVNEDFVENFEGEPYKIQVITEEYVKLFNQIYIPLIPQLLYLEDTQTLAAKILLDLSVFDPNTYLQYVLQQIKSYLEKDLTIFSTHTPKMAILFLQEFVCINYLQEHQFTLLIQCCQNFLDVLQKLGISQNLDILELVIRVYIHIPNNSIDDKPIIQNLTQDILDLIQKHMEPMSINLQSTEGEEAELYIDFRNIYFNFIIRLSKQQINALCDKILYKILTSVPGHRQAYEFIVICLGYVQPSFANQILDAVYKHIVVKQIKSNNNGTHSKSNSAIFNENFFPQHLTFSLATYNQEHLRWYSSLIQCVFQYNPENVIANWAKLQTIVVLMLRQFDKPNIFDWGLDIIFNLILNLQNVHLPYGQFFKDSNRKYKTMSNIEWKHPTLDCVKLLTQIKQKFLDSITTFMHKKYDKIVECSEKAQKIKSQKVIKVVVQQSEHKFKSIEVKQSVNQLLESIIAPSIPNPEQMQEKKYFIKLISIQYSVFSALQMKSQYTHSSHFQEIQPFFIKELGFMRGSAIEYLKWILQLFAHYNCLYDPQILKLFHFFWREAHDELYFSTGIDLTNQKLRPFLYPIAHKKKQLFENSFLILTECYVTFMMRIELFCFLKPLAHLNNPQYNDYLVPLSFSSFLDNGLKSIVPTTVNIHKEHHTQILDLCRYKMSFSCENSFIRKYLFHSKSGQSNSSIEKQKYLGAIRVIFVCCKRNLNLFSYSCCLKDEASWFGLLEILEVSQHLQKKNDKVAIIEIIYLMLIFSFDFKAHLFYSANFKIVEKGLASFQEEDQTKLQKVVTFVNYLVQKANVELDKKSFEKYATVLVLIITSCSCLIPLNHEIFRTLLPLALKSTLSSNQDMMNMGKTFLFHIINRYIKLNQNNQVCPNTPVKRSYEQFLIYRHLGGKTDGVSSQPPANLITNKVDNYYYPIQKMEYLCRIPLNPLNLNQFQLLETLHNEQVLEEIFKMLTTDSDLKVGEQAINIQYLQQEQPKKISSNGHKLINFIIDNNPTKLDIFSTFIENFSSYPICFYHRIFRKFMILGGKKTQQICQRIVEKYVRSLQKQEVKLAQSIMAEILPFCLDSKQYYSFYSNYLITCSNQQFLAANSALMIVFCNDWKISKQIFTRIIGRMREEKGHSRLRHLQVFNNYILCVGRFAISQAKNGIDYLLKGIDQGTDEVSELIVSMLIYCFIYPINLTILKQWVKQSSLELASKNSLYRLDNNTGYDIDSSVPLIINQIVLKTSQEKSFESKNLKIYSNIAYKILGSITVYRFNDEFYKLFKEMMLFMVNKPVQQGYDEQIISQMKVSQYPQSIYEDLLVELNKMEGNTINIMKKKLKYIETIVINKSFSFNSVKIPNVFQSISEKQVTIDHILAVSNMARVFKTEQLTREVEILLKQNDKSGKCLYFMMAYLLAAGARNFEWKEKLLNQIISFKKSKIVKDFVSYWWKGRTPETQQEQRLYMLVRIVQNPYSYFA